MRTGAANVRSRGLTRIGDPPLKFFPSTRPVGKECLRAMRARSNAPEVFEPGRGQLGVAHRVLDVLVPEIGLEGGIVALRGQRLTGRRGLQSMWMGLAAKPCFLTSTLKHAPER
jgi:hypothetical protein